MWWNNIPLHVYAAFYLCYLSVGEHLVCFYILITMNNSAVDIQMQELCQSLTSILFDMELGYMSGTAVSYDIPMIDTLKNHTDFLSSGCTILHCHKNTRFTNPLCFHRHILFSFFLKL
jgi:hypothetical protein